MIFHLDLVCDSNELFALHTRKNTILVTRSGFSSAQFGLNCVKQCDCNKRCKDVIKMYHQIASLV